MKSKKKHVAFLMGGLSAEREVSINSGNACYDAIDKEIEDLEKSGWYIMREIKRLKAKKEQV